MKSLMPRYFSKILFSIFITLTVYIPAHAGWIIYHEPALTVRVIDTHTRKPIKDVVVVVMYEKGPIISGPGGGSSQSFHAREQLTEENGEVHFPFYITLMGPNSRESGLDFIIFKPGYIDEYNRKLTDDNSWSIELSKANTWKERRAASGVSIPDSVDNQLPILKEILKNEEKWLDALKNKEWVNYDSDTALISIAKEDRINVAKALIADGANVNYATNVLRTALMEAAREGHSNMVKFLLEKGADVNLQSSQTGRTALMEAAREGYLTEVQSLIKAGADTNIKDIEGGTALTDALGSSVQTAKKDSAAMEIVEILIDGGADINNKQGESALKLALMLNRSKVVNYLTMRGIKLNLEKASSDLIFAASNGNIEAAKILIKNGADINYRTAGFGMMTPLMYAAKRGHLNIVQMLVDLGADVNALDTKSKTARMLAEEAGHSDIAAVLKNAEMKRNDKYK